MDISIKDFNETMRIGGQKVEGDKGQFNVMNPYTNEVVKTVPRASREQVRKAFQTLFDRIDVTDSGAITAKEIQHLIRKHTNKNLTLSQVQKVLCDLDVKGTGDIEFDEFIFMLSQPSNYVRLLGQEGLERVER